MKTISKFLFLFVFAALFVACDDDEPTPLAPVESKSFSNLFAPQSGGRGAPITGDFTKFNFATGDTTTSDTEWDIAFRGTTIIVNGGASSGLTDEPSRTGNAAGYFVASSFAEVTAVNESLLAQDSADGLAIPTGSDNGWYSYNPATNVVSPIASRTLVFRTYDGKYVKVQVTSYYKDAPASPDGFVDEARYYSFNYVYQPNEGQTTFE